jgi:hypothetical protein
MDPSAATGAQTAFDLPPDCVLLGGGIKIRTVGTGASTWRLRHSEGTVMLTDEVINTLADDAELLYDSDAVHGMKNSAAANIQVFAAGTVTTAPTLLVWILAYREDYGS